MKTIKIFYTVLSIFLFTGCGASDTNDTSSNVVEKHSSNTPDIAILQKIKTDKIAGQSNITHLISDYYSRSKAYVSNPKCKTLTVSSSNPFEKSILVFAQEHCSNISSFNKDMQTALTKINTDKSMNIKFDEINGYQDFINMGFSKSISKSWSSKNVSISAVKKLKKRFNNTHAIVKYFNPLIKKGNTDIDDIYKYLSIVSSYEQNNWLKAGVITSKDLAYWQKHHISSTTFLAWKNLGVRNDDILEMQHISNPIDYKNAKEAGIKNVEDYKKWKKYYDMTESDSLRIFLSHKITPEQLDKATKFHPIGAVTAALEDGVSVERVVKGDVGFH